MGERKGQNHYYPADFNYKTHKTLNRYHGVHALRERGAKAHLGIITIRFEMPFNVWCLGCKNHVGMSVRYNAEKKKIGMYYTSMFYFLRHNGLFTDFPFSTNLRVQDEMPSL